MSILEIISRQLSEAVAKNDRTNIRLLEHQLVAELRVIANGERRES